MSVVYHDGLWGQVEMLVEETYTHKVLDVECCKQMADSLKSSARNDDSVINTGQRIVDRGEMILEESILANFLF